MSIFERGVPIDPKEPGHYHDGVICSLDGDCRRLGGTAGCKICGGQAHWEPPSVRMMYRGMGPGYRGAPPEQTGPLCRCSPPLRTVGRGNNYAGGHLHVPDVQAPGRAAGGSYSPASLADEIRKLDALRRNGVLTDGEFQQLKRRLIGQA